jgi:hypothetical protein
MVLFSFALECFEERATHLSPIEAPRSLARIVQPLAAFLDRRTFFLIDLQVGKVLQIGHK